MSTTVMITVDQGPGLKPVNTTTRQDEAVNRLLHHHALQLQDRIVLANE